MTFDQLKPLEIHIHPVEEMKQLRKEMEEKNATVVDVPGCIIDSPQDTMSIPLIGLDVKELVDVVIETSKKKSGPRKKPVCATVRGMGGGKTRAFEEMRRMLLLQEGVLV